MFRKIFSVFAVVVIVFFSNTVMAQPYEDLSYLIIDKTKTPWGHRFYKTFSELWKAPTGIKGYFIVIGEKKPSFKQSWIYVQVGDNIYMRIVYLKLLKPTTSNFEMQKYTLTAAKRTLRFLLTDFERIKILEEKM